MSSRRFAVIAACSANGKTTLGRELAQRLDVDFVELDAWVHGPNWTPTPDAELIARVEPVLASDGWVVDGTYEAKLGTRVLDAADLVVWVDMPLRIWFWWLTRRTWSRWVWREVLWNGNRETLRGALWGRESLYAYAWRTWRVRRRTWPLMLAAHPTLRLRSPREVSAFLDRFAPIPADE
jgi:adenylate kinase family enzyme